MQAPVQTPSPDERSPSEDVLLTVAEAEGVDPSEITPRLYDIVDPDALDRLVDCGTQSSSAVTVTFDYAGWHVRVDSGGEVTLTGRTAPAGDRNPEE